jgi:hypothetical protein
LAVWTHAIFAGVRTTHVCDPVAFVMVTWYFVFGAESFTAKQAR